MRDVLIRSLKQRFLSYADLIEQLDEADLVATIDVPKHKSIAQHLWCIVGARESYSKALREGKWCGFACSMSAYSRSDFAEKLEASSRSLVDTLSAINDWTPDRDELLLSLSEHEVMHEGQIIRHIYGVRKTPPSSWKWA